MIEAVKPIQPTVTIRSARGADAVPLRQVQAAAVTVTFPVPGNSASQDQIQREVTVWLEPTVLEAYADWFQVVVQDAGHLWQVAESAGHLVGFLHAYSLNGSRRLQGLYVLPEWSGRGLGQRLMETFNQWAEDDPATLVVLTHNTRAIRFYAHYGFRPQPFPSSVIPGITTLTRGSQAAAR